MFSLHDFNYRYHQFHNLHMKLPPHPAIYGTFTLYFCSREALSAIQMKVFILLACLLCVAFYVSPQSHTGKDNFAVSSGIQDPWLIGRRLMKEWSLPSSKSPDGNRKAQINKRMQRSGMRKNPTSKAAEKSEETLIYNVDYNGVKTHPSPLPRHPIP